MRPAGTRVWPHCRRPARSRQGPSRRPTAWAGTPSATRFRRHGCPTHLSSHAPAPTRPHSAFRARLRGHAVLCPAMVTNADLVVLGAGPAGLAAAWQAARRGMSVVVLERAHAVGGMAASLEVAGVRVDRGSHRLHPTTPANVLGDLRMLLGDDLQLRRRNGRLHIADRWLGFPLRPTELARALPPELIVRAAAEAIFAPLRRGRPVSYADTLRRGLGPTLYEALYAPYAVKLW